MKLKIGNVTLENNLILAPMAGVTDLPFRILCKEQGCGMVVTEMVSAKAILYKNRNTKALLEVEERERPVSVQLFGSDPEIMADIAKLIEPGPFDIIDVNMGCPVPKIVNNGEGSAMMKNPKLAEAVLGAMVKAVKKPVTVKFRKGFTDSDVNAVEFARMAESCGVAAVAVHGRTREQYYSGAADWDAKALLDETGCDGIMIARGAKGNPWIFSRTLYYLETGELLPPPSMEELQNMVLRHAKMSVEHKGEYLGIREMRKHMAWYTAGLPHSAKLRNDINAVETLADLETLVMERFAGHFR